MAADLREKIESLRDRELECLRGVCHLKRTDEIADDLGLKPKTVDTTISAAAAKLGVSDRATAARLLIAAAKTPWGKSLGEFLQLPSAGQPPAGTWLSRLPWPWPTEWRPENDHPVAIKLILIVLLAMGMMLSVAAYLGMTLLVGKVF